MLHFGITTMDLTLSVIVQGPFLVPCHKPIEKRAIFYCTKKAQSRFRNHDFVDFRSVHLESICQDKAPKMSKIIIFLKYLKSYRKF